MLLTKLGVENFKCFSKYQEIDLGRITLLTGANSSGKSSLIAAILVAMQSEMFPFEFITNGKLVEFGSYEELVNNNDVNQEVGLFFETKDLFNFRIKIAFDSNTYNIYINEIILNTNSAKELYSRSEIISIFKSLNSILPSLNQLKKLIDESENNIKESKNNLNTLEELNYSGNQSKRLNIINDNLQESLNIIVETRGAVLIATSRIFQQIVNNFSYIGSFRQPPSRGFLRTNAQNPKVKKDGSGYLEQLIKWQDDNAPQLEKLIKQLEALELAYHIETPHLGGGMYDLQVKTSKNGKAASLADVGFGISQFLPIMVADNQMSDSSTLIVSQPEIHLHPSIQSKFGEYLTNQVNNTEKSYIIETHSEYLLNRIRLAIVKGELKEEDVKVYYLENNTTDVEIHQLELTKTGKINNAPDNFFETYMVDSMEIMLNAME